MIAHLSVGLVFNVIAFAAIGWGPTIWALRGSASGLRVWALSPGVGVALVTIAGTWLVAADRPVSYWTTPLLVVGFAGSMTLTIAATLSDRNTWRTAWREMRLPAAVFVLAAALMILPQLIGGLQFSILRGNGTDSFNYIAAAGYLDHEPLSWVEQADSASVIERNPSYSLVHDLLQTRWATFMLLAFSSRIAALEPLQFEYVFSVLMLLLTFGPIYVWCRDGMGTSSRVAIACAFVACTGFWAQFVIDVRADAHQHSLPILLTLGCALVLRTRPESHDERWRAFGLIGLLVAALALAYPEILPSVALGVSVWLLIGWRHREFARSRVLDSMLAGTVAALALTPVLGTLTTFVRHQVAYASTGVNDWERFYFPWLYRAPLSGFWGFGPIVALNVPGATLLWLAFTLVALGLTVALTAALWRVAHASTAPGLALAAAMAGATLLQAAWLLWHGQRWAAGKAVSFGYPFYLLAVVGLIWSSLPTGVGVAPWLRAARLSGLVFIATQLVLSLARPLLAYSGQDYTGYMYGHSEHRRHDWAIGAIERMLDAQPGMTVWAYLQNPWVAEYAALALGEHVRYVNLGATLDRAVAAAGIDRRTHLPDYILLDRETIDGNEGVKARAIVSGDFALLSSIDGPVLLGVDNPNGAEQAAGKPLGGMGGRPSYITILSPSDGCARIQGRFPPGPSWPESPVRHIVFTDELGQRVTLMVAQAETWSLPMALKPGVNVVRFQIEEAPTVAAPDDPRPLLLHAERLRIDPTPCAVGLR